MKFERLQKQLEGELSLFSKQYQGVVVSCSGGVDSTVLFHLIFKILNEKKIKLNFGICHVNFGLREKDSDKDAAFVKGLSEKTGALFFEKLPQELSPIHSKESVQMWARRLRYDFFEELTAQGWLIALAHHKDDLAENIMLRLARGTSPSSLSGMSTKYKHFWRPLLRWQKKDLMDYASRNNLLYRHDSSNDTIKYTRNKVRHNLMPSFESLHQGALDHLLFFAEDVKDLMSVVDQKINDLFALYLEEANGLRLEAFCHLNDGTARHLLVAYLSKQNVPSSSLSRELLSDGIRLIRRQLRETASKDKPLLQIDLPRGFKLFCNQRRLWVTNP